MTATAPERLTDAELEEIESVVRDGYDGGPADYVHPSIGPTLRLVAEVRRLRALVARGAEVTCACPDYGGSAGVVHNHDCPVPEMEAETGKREAGA